MVERRARALRQVWLTAVLAAGILVGGLLSLAHLRLRLDLTAEREHTLSPATLGLLQQLEDRLQLKLYFNRETEGAEVLLPLRLQVEDFLEELVARSRGRVVLETVDPTSDALARSHAEHVGIEPVPWANPEVGSLSYVELYQGLELRYQDRSEVIPFLAPGQLEFAVAVRLANLLRRQRPVIGFFSREPALPPPVPGIELPVPEERIYEDLREVLGRRYAVRDLDLERDGPLTEELVAVVVARPEEVSERELFEIDQYLVRGGRVLVLWDNESYDPRTFERRALRSGMDSWLEANGLRLLPRLVWDQEAVGLTVGRRQVQLPDGSSASVPLNMSYGFWPLLGGDSLARDHVATASLEQVRLFWAHPVVLTAPLPDVRAEVLLRTSPQAWTLPPEAPTFITAANIERLRGEAFASGPPSLIPLAVALRGPFPSGFRAVPGAAPPPDGTFEGGVASARQLAEAGRSGLLVVIGDSDLFRNGLMPAGSENAALAENLADWLAQDESLIALRSRGQRDRALRDFYGEWIEAQGGWSTSEAENQELDRAANRYARRRQLMVGWSNVLVPPLIVLLVGLGGWQLRRRQAARPFRPGTGAAAGKQASRPTDPETA